MRVKGSLAVIFLLVFFSITTNVSSSNISSILAENDIVKDSGDESNLFSVTEEKEVEEVDVGQSKAGDIEASPQTQIVVEEDGVVVSEEPEGIKFRPNDVVKNPNDEPNLFSVTEEKEVEKVDVDQPKASDVEKFSKPRIAAKEDRMAVNEKPKVVRVRSEEKKIVLDSAKKGWRYFPYLQAGGYLFVNGPDTAAGSLDLFIPILQWDRSDLIFSDLRIYDRSGPAFEGNLHLGYRHLFSESEQILGIFGAFDRRKTYTGNYFNQLMIGAEYWWKRFFVGGNAYCPVGEPTRDLGGVVREGNVVKKESFTSITLTTDRSKEKAIGGFDLEVGYEFIDGLVGYAGGYYFNGNRVDGVYGPRARITYDLLLDSKNVFKIFNKVGLEVGVQHDKQRGTVWNFGLNVRIGLWPEKTKSLDRLARHMVDLVRRDVDIITANGFFDPAVKPIMKVWEPKDEMGFYEALKKADPKDRIIPKFDLKSFKIKKENLVKRPRGEGPQICLNCEINKDAVRNLRNDNPSAVIITVGTKGKGVINDSDYKNLTSHGYTLSNYTSEPKKTTKEESVKKDKPKTTSDPKPEPKKKEEPVKKDKPKTPPLRDDSEKDESETTTTGNSYEEDLGDSFSFIQGNNGTFIEKQKQSQNVTSTEEGVKKGESEEKSSGKPGGCGLETDLCMMMDGEMVSYSSRDIEEGKIVTRKYRSQQEEDFSKRPQPK